MICKDENDVEFDERQQWVILYCECHQICGEMVDSNHLNDAYVRKYGEDDDE